jgi:hypothetical protein
MKDHSTLLISDASRRDFFKQLVLGGSGLYLSPLLFQSCNGEDLGRPPFGVWEDMIKVLEQSPDNLVARHKALVASKDPKAMTDFVRDSFQIMPWQSDFLHHAAYGSIYGTDMALRCGMATPREKAEILKDMLVEAGFEAKVVIEKTAISLEEAKSLVYRKYIPEFNPPITKRKIRQWNKAMEVTNEQDHVDYIPNYMENAEALANDLLNQIDPQYIRDRTVNFRFHKDSVPSVVFQEGETEKYAHVFDPAVPYGQLHPSNTEQDFHDAGKMKPYKDEEVTISLSCRNALDKWNETTLVSGTWKLSELLGNQLQIQFLNNMGFEEQATRNVSQISTFTPCLALQCIDKEPAYAEQRSYLGDPITLEGENVLKTYNPTNLPKEKEAAAIPNIHSFDAQVFPQAFPKVRLEVSPKDVDGNVIEGLSIGNFLVKDNGKPVTTWMKQNTVSPKILLLYDTSASMPAEYAGEKIKKFLEETKETIGGAYPTVTLILQQTGSNIYTSLLKAKQLDVDLILYATDGDNNDQFDSAFTPIYESGPPAIFLNVKPKGTIYRHLRENMDFIEIAADDQERTIAEINQIVEGMKFPSYVLTYNALEEVENHEVEISVANTSHQRTLSYRFPEKSDHLLGNRMVGIYLTLSRRGKSPIRRVLAGYEPHLDFYADPTRLTRKMIDEVHEMLLGGAVMAFEREAPTLALQLTEYLKTLMSNREWFEAQQDNDIPKALEALGKGTLSYPPILLSMMQPLNENFTNESVTYPQGFRACLVKLIPGYYSPHSRTSFDYLPTSDYLSVNKAGTDNFAETLRKTAQLAILEGHVFQTSALSELSQKTLALNRDRSSYEKKLPKISGTEYHYFAKQIFGGSTLKIFDVSLEKRSYWRVDTVTGELYGILPDQTGGGSSSTEEQLRNLETVMKEYNKILSAIKVGMSIPGIGSTPLSIVAAYSFTLVRLYAIASEAIILMSTEKMDEQLTAAMQQLACNVLKAITVSKAKGPLSKGNSGIEFLIAAMGSNAPIC